MTGQDSDDTEQPQKWYSSNLVGVASTLLGSALFNAHPVALSIAGVRESHAGLFAMLAHSSDLSEAREMFLHYQSIVFGLRRPQAQELSQMGLAEQRRWRCSWRKLLQGWGMDSNGPAGAVLKGWVESRFGLVPLFHKESLLRFPSPAWIQYLVEKVEPRYQGNTIHQQLDLLYEFCQWALARFPVGPAFEASATHVRLWRGSTRCEEQLVAGELRQRHCTLRLNNLLSFSLSRDEAGCFGDWILEALVPKCKILVFPGLLPDLALQQEQEVLALGGDYQVEASYV